MSHKGHSNAVSKNNVSSNFVIIWKQPAMKSKG